MSKIIGVLKITMVLLSTILALPAIAQKSASRPSAEELEAMALNMRPGEAHARLATLAGTWNLNGRFRLVPDGPWTSFQATVESDLVLGGRFLTQRVKGQKTEWMPEPHEGLLVLGHDNQSERFLLVEMSNYDTGWWHAAGVAAENGREITFTSTEDVEPSGLRKRLKMVFKLDGEDRYVVEEWDEGADGEPFVAIELVVRRAASSS